MNNRLIFEHQQDRKQQQFIRKFRFKNIQIFLFYFNRFDEEKSIECPTCKKTFKNGAALNGHMRLHGGYVAVCWKLKYLF